MGIKSDQTAGLINLNGLEFRSEPVDCRFCGWQGVAGMLRAPNPEALDNSVIYTCPNCRETIAMHNGLTTQEVMQEMQKIREILAGETVETCIDAKLAEGKDESTLDFKRVREQICVATPAKEDSPEDTVLDFDDIRARLKIA